MECFIDSGLFIKNKKQRTYKQQTYTGLLRVHEPSRRCAQHQRLGTATATKQWQCALWNMI